ncbi:MAG: L-lactate dehydrogenase [Clostridiales bacterium]|nr:L-lactate dehydrogenase [Clostridiales bacterium]
MKCNLTKVVIIGAGAVGATTAFSLVVKGVAAEVALIDINAQKAQGEIWDIQHSMDFQSRNVRVTAGEYADCADADIVVITASAPMNGERSRLELLAKTEGIMRRIVPQVMQSGFDGVFIVVSNPVDIMTYLVRELSGFPKNRVIGTGTVLETARLKQAIGQIMDMDLRGIDAYVMGEHGDSMMVPWSHVRAGGKPFVEILADNPARYAGVRLTQLVERVKSAGNDVMQAKGNTQYGIAGAVTGIVSAILRDENKIFAVSALLEGEYGVFGVYCGVPALINRNGVAEIGEFNLTAEERGQFERSAAVLREHIGLLGRG